MKTFQDEARYLIDELRSEGAFRGPFKSAVDFYLQNSGRHLNLAGFNDWVSGKGRHANSLLEADLEQCLDQDFSTGYEKPRRFWGKAAMAIGTGLSFITAMFAGHLASKKDLHLGPAEPIISYQAPSYDIMNLTENGDSQMPYVYGDEIIFKDNVANQYVIYNDLDGSFGYLGVTSFSQPMMNEDFIVWQDSLEGFKFINRSTGDLSYRSTGAQLNGYDLSGDMVVYSNIIDYDAHESRIGLLDMTAKRVSSLTSACAGNGEAPNYDCTSSPQIDGDTVVWGFFNETRNEEQMIVHNLSDGSQFELDYAGGELTELEDNLIVMAGSVARHTGPNYEANKADYDKEIVIFDIETMQETTFDAGFEVTDLSLSNGKLAYQIDGIDYSAPGFPAVRSVNILDLESQVSEQVYSAEDLEIITHLNLNDGVVGFTENIGEFDGVWTFTHDIKLVDTSGRMIGPLSSGNIELLETTLLNYDRQQPAKFILDAFFGSDRDFQFDYGKSNIEVLVDSTRQIDSAYLIVRNENGNTIDTLQLIPNGTKDGKQAFDAEVSVSTPSTGRLYGEAFIGGLVENGGDIGLSAVEALALGSLQTVTEDFEDVRLDVEINNREYVKRHLVSTVVNDPNSWNTSHKDIQGFSPIEIGIEQNGVQINNAHNVFISKDTHPTFGIIFNPTGTYTYKITGTGDGTYTFIHRDVDNLTVVDDYIHRDVAIKSGEVHTIDSTGTLNIPQEPTPPPEDTDTTPRAGSASGSNALLWSIAPATLGLAGVGYYIGKKKSRKNSEEE